MLKLLGFERQEFEGQPFNIVFTPDDVKQEVPEQVIRNARIDGRSVEQRYLLRRDGSSIWIDGILIAMYDGDGKVERYSKIIRDGSKNKALG